MEDREVPDNSARGPFVALVAVCPAIELQSWSMRTRRIGLTTTLNGGWDTPMFPTGPSWSHYLRRLRAMSKVTLSFDEKYDRLVRQRVEMLQQQRARELRNVGREELAERVAGSDPNRADYVKELVKADLQEAGLTDE